MVVKLTGPQTYAVATTSTATLPANRRQNAPAIAQSAEAAANAAAQVKRLSAQLPVREHDRHQPDRWSVRESAVRKVGDVVQSHPEEAMAIVRTWLHQQA
jgi:flagellar M-ring protein FliF